MSAPVAFFGPTPPPANRPSGATGATGASGATGPASPAFASFLAKDEGDGGDAAVSLDDESARRARQGAAFAMPVAVPFPVDAPVEPGAGPAVSASDTPATIPAGTSPMSFQANLLPTDALSAGGEKAARDPELESKLAGSPPFAPDARSSPAASDDESGAATNATESRSPAVDASPFSTASGPPSAPSTNVAAVANAAAPNKPVDTRTPAAPAVPPPASGRIAPAISEAGPPPAPAAAVAPPSGTSGAAPSPVVPSPAQTLGSRSTTSPRVASTKSGAAGARGAKVHADSASGTGETDSDDTGAPPAAARTSPDANAILPTASALDPARSVKPMTVVTKMAPDAQAANGAAGERLREAFASVANQSVIRGAASGEIVLPDLGRVAVHAKSTASGVEVDVTADHADARNALRLHAGAMEVDLKQAEVRVGRLTIDASHGASYRSDSSAGGQAGQAFDSPGRRDPSSSGEGDGEGASEDRARDASGGSASPGRVRIVL